MRYASPSGKLEKRMAWGIGLSIRAGLCHADLLMRQLPERIGIPRSLAEPCGDPKKLLLCHWRTRTFFESSEPFAPGRCEPARSCVLASANLRYEGVAHGA